MRSDFVYLNSGASFLERFLYVQKKPAKDHIHYSVYCTVLISLGYFL